MPPLWQWDQDAFRAIHVGLRREWLDPIIVAITFTGLGYAQGAWLMISAFRKLLDWRMLIGIHFGVAVAVALIEHSPLAFAASLVGSAVTVSLTRPVALCAFWSLVSSGVVRLILAKTIARQRPSNLDFASALENVRGFTSFPSGHVTTTWAVVTVICWCLAKTEQAWLAWVVIAWASLVSFSRIYVGVHYPLDVIAGLFLGVATGSVFYWIWRSKGWLTQEPEPIALNRE